MERVNKELTFICDKVKIWNKYEIVKRKKNILIRF
jgi:hypothetical protein